MPSQVFTSWFKTMQMQASNEQDIGDTGEVHLKKKRGEQYNKKG
jgi:hypothetical protein